MEIFLRGRSKTGCRGKALVVDTRGTAPTGWTLRKTPIVPGTPRLGTEWGCALSRATQSHAFPSWIRAEARTSPSPFPDHKCPISTACGYQVQILLGMIYSDLLRSSGWAGLGNFIFLADDGHRCNNARAGTGFLFPAGLGLSPSQPESTLPLNPVATPNSPPSKYFSEQVSPSLLITSSVSKRSATCVNLVDNQDFLPLLKMDGGQTTRLMGRQLKSIATIGHTICEVSGGVTPLRQRSDL